MEEDGRVKGPAAPIYLIREQWSWGSQTIIRRLGIGIIVEILDFRLPNSAALEDDEVQGVGGRRAKEMKVIRVEMVTIRVLDGFFF